MSLGLVVLAFLPMTFASAQGPQKKKFTEAQKQQILARFGKLAKLKPAEFIKLYDKNKNENIDKVEAPKFLQRGFPRLDKDSNDKLDQAEVAQYLTFIRRFVTQLQRETPKTAPKKTQPKTATKQNQRAKFIFQRIMAMDKNGDGKITRKEASAKLAPAFGRFDKNGDAALDQKEIRTLVQTFAKGQTRQKGRPGFRGGRPARDFDSFDADANGRVTRAELQNSPFARQFAQMDADNNGYLTRREFENYSPKQ